MNKVLVSDNIIIPCDRQKALAVIWDIQQIAKYEPKLTSVEVIRETDKNGIYKTKGYFAGIPWQGSFTYEITERGFYSEMIESPVPGLKVKGGFFVETKEDKDIPSGKCKVIHYEHYQLPVWLTPVAPLLKAYITFSMKKELKDLEKIILEN